MGQGSGAAGVRLVSRSPAVARTPRWARSGTPASPLQTHPRSPAGTDAGGPVPSGAVTPGSRPKQCQAPRKAGNGPCSGVSASHNRETPPQPPGAAGTGPRPAPSSPTPSQGCDTGAPRHVPTGTGSGGADEVYKPACTGEPTPPPPPQEPSVTRWSGNGVRPGCPGGRPLGACLPRPVPSCRQDGVSSGPLGLGPGDSTQSTGDPEPRAALGSTRHGVLSLDLRVRRGCRELAEPRPGL